MKKFLFIFFLSLNIIYSQRNEDSLTIFNENTHEKIYSIYFPNVPIELEIIKYNNSKIEGYIITGLDKNTKIIDEDDYENDEDYEKEFEKYNTIVYDIFKLNNKTSSHIYNKILKNNIENLENCNDPFDLETEEDCNNYLDPSSASFKIYRKGYYKKVYIDILDIKVENNDIQNLPEKQKNAQYLITKLDENLDIQELLKKAISRIVKTDNKPIYTYGSRGYMIRRINNEYYLK